MPDPIALNPDDPPFQAGAAYGDGRRSHAVIRSAEKRNYVTGRVEPSLASGSRSHQDSGAMTDPDFVVLDPDDPNFAAAREPAVVASDPLTHICQRSAAALATDTAAKAYLNSVGVSDPTMWSAFRLGAGGPTVANDLSPADLADLTNRGLVHATHRTVTIAKPGGINVPTFDPRNPERPVGVIRLTPAQHRHVFASHPVGIGCASTIGAAQRVVVVDGPLMGLRLAQAGVENVILLEDPETLRPFIDWFAARTVVIVGTRPERIARARAALDAVGEHAIVASINSDLAISADATLAVLGITRAAIRAPEPKPDLTPRMLLDLMTYARDRVSAGIATEALRAWEIADADLVSAFRIGFLDANYQNALRAPMRRALHGMRLGNSLVLPAIDEQDQVVDLHVLYAGVGGRSYHGCFTELRGLIGAHVLVGADRLIVTDTVPWLARLHRQGYRNVLFLRGPEDAALNAKRIAAAGVRSVCVRSYRNAEPIRVALAAAGIEVVVEKGVVGGNDWISVPAVPAVEASMPLVTTAESPVPEPVVTSPSKAAPGIELKPEPIPVSAIVAPVLVAAPPPTMTLMVNTTEDVAICEIGPVRYAISLCEPDQTSRHVVVRRGRASHQDRFDLSVPAQCQRFAGSAARRVELESERLVAQLAEAWRLVREHETQAGLPPIVAIAADERADAEAMLRDPQLLARIGSDLTALGWVGEDRAKGLLYLTAVGRLLPDPLWSVYRATAGAAPWRYLGIIASLMPPEACVIFQRLTETLLRKADRSSFRNRLLLVDRAETLRPEGAIALRCLREWGSIGWKAVARAEGAIPGAPPGFIGDALGPVAVLAAAAGDLDHRCRDCFLTVTVDESPEQTEAVLAEQRRQHGHAASQAEHAPIIVRRHHAMQRLLRPSAVVIPFADRIAFPTTSIRHRDEQAAFLALIQVSALLHQYQRERDATGAIVAAETDFHHALAVAGHLLGSSAEGLSAHSRHLLQRLFASSLTDFVLSDLGDLIPDWTLYTYRACAEELTHMGYCTASGGGQGRVRRYTLTGRASTGCGIALLTVGSEHHRQPFDLSTTFRGGSKGASPSIHAG